MARHQTGASFWEYILSDLVAGSTKKVILVVDLFCGVGDSVAGLYSLLKARKGVTPLLFMMAMDFREPLSACTEWVWCLVSLCAS